MSAPDHPTPNPDQLLTLAQARIMLQYETNQAVNEFINAWQSMQCSEFVDHYPTTMTRAQWLTHFHEHGL